MPKYQFSVNGKEVVAHSDDATPDQVTWGAGEPTATTLAAAIGNAVFDAIGVWLRSVPFTPAKVLAAIKKS